MRGSRSKLKTVAPRPARTAQRLSGGDRLKETQHDRILGHEGRGCRVGSIDSDDQSGARKGRGLVGSKVCPGPDVGLVGECGGRTGTGLHHDMPPGGDELLHDIGDEGDPTLSGSCFCGDGQFHGGCV